MWRGLPSGDLRPAPRALGLRRTLTIRRLTPEQQSVVQKSCVENDHRRLFPLREAQYITPAVRPTTPAPVPSGAFLKVAWNIAKRRVKAIVEKKHRRAYKRAATLVAAIAEAQIVAGDTTRAAPSSMTFVTSTGARMRSVASLPSSPGARPSFHPHPPNADAGEALL
jgi:hypothetical protein